MPNLEEEVAKLPDKDGWIKLNDFMKFALTTELCKIEFQDRVFQKVDYDEERKKSEAKKDSKARVRFPPLFGIFMRILHICRLKDERNR